MHKNCLSHTFAYLSGVLLDDSLNCTGTWGNMNFDFAIKLYGGNLCRTLFSEERQLNQKIAHCYEIIYFTIIIEEAMFRISQI